MSRDLVVFGEDWGSLPSSTQHLMRNLCKTRKVLWVNSIGLRKPKLTLADLKRVWKKISSHQQKGTKTVSLPRGKFSLINPLTIPAPSSRLERYMAAKLLQRQVLKAIKKAQLNDPILWMSLPTATDLIGKLGDRASVYYCGDDFSALAGVDHQTVNAREMELKHKADLIITASEKLANKFSSQNTRLLTHGVDYNLFSKTAARAQDFEDNNRPVAGFYGSISEWMDLPLLIEVIKRMPHWDFILIGQPVINTEKLAALPNVKLMGPRPHQQLPCYSQHWDASLLPFKNNAQIRACNPLKLSEYLAAGTPIVSTRFPALEPYRALVSVAETATAMTEALENSLYLPQIPAFNSVLSKTVANNSWSSKAQQVSDWLDQL